MYTIDSGFNLSVCYKEANPDQLDAFIDEVQQEGRLTGDTKDLLEKLDEDPKKKEEKEVLVLCIIHLHQRRFRRIYHSTNPSPHDPQNLLLAQTNRPMKTPGRIFSIFPSCQSD